jgi:hypothetical protein
MVEVAVGVDVAGGAWTSGEVGGGTLLLHPVNIANGSNAAKINPARGFFTEYS